MTTTVQIDLADLLEQKYPHGFHIPADIEIRTILECGDDDWSHELDLEELLSEKQLIGIVWNIRLVLDERPDLTDDQAWSVLQACQPRFEEVTDAMQQIVRQMAESSFPKPKGKAGLRSLLTAIERKIELLPEEVRTDPAGYGAVASLLDSIESLVKEV